MEDHNDQTYNLIEFMALVEYEMTDEDKAKVTTQGALDMAEVKVLVAMDTLAEPDGLLQAGKHLPDTSEGDDYMEINEESFKVILAVPEGGFEQTNVVLTIYGKKDERPV